MGLEVGSKDPEVQRKRIKLSSAVQPPKYGSNLTLNFDDAEDSGYTCATPPESPKRDDNNRPVSRKGKEKME